MSISSSMLFKVAGVIFLGLPIGHTQMYNDTVAPGLVPLGNALAAYSSKVSWNQANGYFLASALLCFKWAQTGIDLKAGLDRYIFGVLMATHSTSGYMYLRKGIPPPAVVYWTICVLMGIAAAKSP